MSTIADTEPFFFNNIDEGKEYLKEIISETIKYHLISDANNGIALSSGLDSNLILCNIDSHEKIKSLTVDFNIDGSIKDELKIAQLHSLKKEVLNKSINLKELNINDELNFFLENMDTPTNDGFNTLILSKLAKKNDIKVLLTGIGADEIFMGYPSFSRANKYYNILKLLSKFNYKGFPKKILSSLVEFLNLNLKFSEIFDVNSIKDLHKLSRRLFLDKEIKDILIDKKISTNSNNLNYKVKNSNFDKLDTKSKLMFLEIEYYLCPKLLKDTDWTSMTQSVEIRTPFVDSVFFVQYLKLFKSNLKINKDFIYEAYKDVLPSEIGKRKKSGFGIPNHYLNKKLKISTRFKNSLKDWSLNNLNYYIN
jgi:asparagine synthase (glutamine-hydrolysing)